MCYSALVRQNLTWLSKRYGAEGAWELFQELFRRRVDDDGVQFSRALDVHVMQMAEEKARVSQDYIEQYRAKQARAWEQELFKQRKRLVDAQRKHQIKETKAARNDERIATEKMATLSGKLSTLHSEQIDGDDARIFPKKYYVPVVTNDAGRLLIRPMRYLCRLPGKPASYDELYKGCYNARRDNLNGFWSGLYGKNHGVIVVESFFENVPRHLYEKRELAPGERESNVVLHFNPNTGVPMPIACLWSHWSHPRDPELYSFAAITDEPPPEILATKQTHSNETHKKKKVRDWLNPEQTSK